MAPNKTEEKDSKPLAEPLLTEDETEIPGFVPKKGVRITVIGRSSRVINGKKFTAKSQEFGPGELPWTAEQFNAAKKDPHLVVEALDDRGNVFVPRRDRAGNVVEEGLEHVPPPVKNKVVETTDNA